MRDIKLANYTGSQLRLIQQTFAKDCNNQEFDLYINTCINYGLDPFKKQIYAQVYNKDKADKRQLVIVVGIDGLRSIASRSADYRPDDDEPIYKYDDALKSAANPLGILSCSVKAWKQDDLGEWNKINGTAYWDEFAPLKDTWVYNPELGRKAPNGEQELGETWRKMPRLMIAKVAEAQALRKGWPNTSGLYAEEELHRMDVVESTASEIVEQHRQDQHLLAISGKDSITIQWEAGSPLQPEPIGKVGDKIISHIKHCSVVAQVNAFEEINRHQLKEYWIKDKNGALEVKKIIEKRKQELLNVVSE